MIDPEERIQRQLARQRGAQMGSPSDPADMGPPPLNATQPVGNPVGLPPTGTPPAGNSTNRETNVGPWASGYGAQPANIVVPPAGSSSMASNGPAGSADMAWRKTLSYGGPGQMNGFNTTGAGYDDKAANSLKNTAGRILSRYPSTPEGLKQAVQDPDFARAFPNATLVQGGAGDKIDFGGTLSDFESGVPVGVVDVGQSFDPSNNTGAGWWWGHDQGGPSEGGAGAGANGGANFGMDLSKILAGTDPMADIIKRIQDLQDGKTPDAETQALLAQLRGI